MKHSSYPGVQRKASDMPLFGKSQKSPQELVRSLREGLVALTRETGEKKLDKVPKVKNVFQPCVCYLCQEG